MAPYTTWGAPLKVKVCKCIWQPVRTRAGPLVLGLNQEPHSLPKRELRISRSLSVRACPAFICLLLHLPCYKNIILEEFSQNSHSPQAPLPRTSQGHPALPEPLHSPAPAPASSGLQPCRRARFLASLSPDLPLPSQLLPLAFITRHTLMSFSFICNFLLLQALLQTSGYQRQQQKGLLPPPLRGTLR